MSITRKLLLITPFLSLLFFVVTTFAAAPDGAGPWADSVFSSSQGLMKNGGAVPAIRSNTASALGVAENNTVEGNFYSLGFGGSIALGFDNGVSNGAMIVETTNPGYPGETANVEMSEDGVTWVMAGSVTQDGTVDIPEQLTCAQYVRITDTSNPAIMPDDIADGYDVDGVQATGDSCTPVSSPSPSSSPSDSPSPSPSPSEAPSTAPSPTPQSSCCSPTTEIPGPGGGDGGGPAASTAPGFPNAGNVVPGFPNAGSRVPGLPNAGVGPEADWSIAGGLEFILSILSKAFNW